MVSDKVQKALQILADNADITASKFAELMWNTSTAWNKVYNTGNGATRGKGMWLSAGGFLSKLSIRGFVFIQRSENGQNTFRLSSEGRRALREAKTDK